MYVFVYLGVKCPAISLEHSNISGMDNKRFPDMIQVTCDIGYTLNGPSSIQCKESGEWSKRPTCDGELHEELCYKMNIILKFAISILMY